MVTRYRWFMVVCLLCALAVLVGGCVATTATPPPSAATPAADEATRAADQKLFIVWEGGWGNGPIPGLDAGLLPTITYLPAFETDTQGNLIPALAASYDANEDNTVFTLHLDPKAVWSDGKPITAQDFVDWYNFIYHPDRSTWTANYVFGGVQGMKEFQAKEADTISGFQALDDKTLQVTLIRSEGWFPLRMSWRWSAPGRVDQYLPLVEGKTFETPKDQRAAMVEPWVGDAASNLIVSGPYKYVHLEPEPAAIYKWELNPNWWGDKQPIVTEIEGTTIRDFQTMSLMFENGEVDILLQLSGPPAVQLRQKMPEVFHEKPSYGWFEMSFDFTKEPVDDINLRKALMHAIDWEQVTAIAWEGELQAPHGGNFLGPNFRCYDANYQPYPFDLAKAQEYLALSKYGPTGADVPRIRILTAGSDPSRIRAAEIIQEMWRVNLGIENVEIKNAESEFVDGQGLVAIKVGSGGALLPLPSLVLQNLAHSSSGHPQEIGFSDPELDAEIENLLTMDPNDPAYCGAVQPVLEKVSDQAFIIPTAISAAWYQVQPWVKGFAINERDWPTWAETWVAEH